MGSFFIFVGSVKKKKKTYIYKRNNQYFFRLVVSILFFVFHLSFMASVTVFWKYCL